MRTLAVSLVLLAACRGDAPHARDAEVATETQSIVDGSPLGVGTLRFLNDAATTFAVLDEGVPLAADAAKNLIVHRDGADALLGTDDDNLYDDLKEVLAVPRVGPVSLEKIAAYAESLGYVPEGDEVLGEWDGVTFTVNEAEATLALVNSASETELDDDIGLDSRAVESILEARPIASIKVLAELYYVGKAALEALKAAAGGASCETHALPAPTSYTAGCTERIAVVLTAAETAQTNVSSTQANACSVDADAARFIDLYVDYWMNVAGVPEMVVGDDGPREMNVVMSRRGAAGRVVSVDIGADEDRLDFVLDADDELLAYYQHNQSPDAAFHCAQSGEPPASAPDAECLGFAIVHLQHTQAIDQSGTATSFTSHDPLVQAVVQNFRTAHGLSGSVALTYDYSFFQRAYDENGLAIELSHNGITWRYLAANVFGQHPYVLTRDDVWMCSAL